MAVELSESETARIERALEALNTSFIHYLDHGDVEALIDLFCDDALYTHGGRRSEGKDAIAEFFRNRAAAGPRTSRHLASGLRIEILGPTTAAGSSVCLTFAADGLPPLPATPLLVADFIDTYELSADRKWRFKTRHIERIFVDPVSTGPVALPD